MNTRRSGQEPQDKRTASPSDDAQAGASRRKSPRGVLFVAILCIAGLGGIYLGLPWFFSGDDGEAVTRTDDEPLAVEIVLAERTPVDETVRAVGQLHPFDEASIGFQVDGYVHSLDFEAGDAFGGNDILAVMDTRDFEADLARAEAEVRRVRAGLGMPADDTAPPALDAIGAVRRARAVLEGEEKNIVRVRELAAIDSATPSELDAAETALAVARHGYQEARDLVRERIGLLGVREAELAQARLRLDHASLRAPFDGVIREKLSGPGEYREVGDPVYAVVRTDRLRLRLDIAERDARRVRTGQMVRFRFDESSDEHEAAITRILPSLDAATRVMTAEAEIDNPGDWRPGFFVHAEVITAEGVPSITVPRDAITSFVGIHRVFIVSDGAAEAREVRLGRRIGDRVVVVEGLEGGEELVRGPGTMRSGTPVTPLPASER